MSSLLGRNIGKYEIREQLGQGGMATVYLGYEAGVDRFVAIKVLPPHPGLDAGFIERFQQEARTVARLNHPHILALHDHGATDDNVLYLVTPYIDGGSLDRYMSDGRMDARLVERIAREVASALDYAHRQGVIHRDIKPANILIDADGNAFVADFGIAKLATGGANLTGTGVVGTPAYMSPEQAQGLPLDSRSDLYALGVMVYEMLCGNAPFKADTPMQLVLKHINEPPADIRTHNPTLPPEMSAVMARILTKNPNDRYQTGAEFIRDLSASLSGGALDQKTERLAIAPSAVMPAPVTAPSAYTAENPPMMTTGTTIINQGLDARWVFGGFALLAVVILGAVFILVNNNPAAPTGDRPVDPTTAAVAPTQATDHTTHSDEPIPTLEIDADVPPVLLPSVPVVNSVGQGSYSQSTSPADTLTVRVQGIVQPPGGQAYVAWLVNTREDTALNVGRLAVDPAGNGALVYTNPDRVFLPVEYNALLISLENSATADSVESPSGTVRYRGESPVEVMDALRVIFVEAEDGFRGRGFLESALAEARFSTQHAGLAAGSNNVPAMRVHVEHTLNILEGGLVDYDGNGTPVNPGTGKGIEAYLSGIDAAVQSVIDAPDADARLQGDMEIIRVCLDNVRQWTEELIALELELLNAPSMEAVARQLEESTTLSLQLSSGFDLNENGIVEPFEGECGLEQIATFGTLIATLEIIDLDDE